MRDKGYVELFNRFLDEIGADAEQILAEVMVLRAADHKQCRGCGVSFAYGPKTGRKSTAEFCSTKCYNAAHYQRRKKRAA